MFLCVNTWRLYCGIAVILSENFRLCFRVHFKGAHSSAVLILFKQRQHTLKWKVLFIWTQNLVFYSALVPWCQDTYSPCNMMLESFAYIPIPNMWMWGKLPYSHS